MKRAFHDRLLIIIALCFACCLAGCSAGLPQSGAESMSEQATENQGVLQEQRNCVEQLGIPSASDTVTQTPTPKAEHARSVDFRYIHRGFTAVPWNNSEKQKNFQNFGNESLQQRPNGKYLWISIARESPTTSHGIFQKTILLPSLPKAPTRHTYTPIPLAA